MEVEQEFCNHFDWFLGVCSQEEDRLSQRVKPCKGLGLVFLRRVSDRKDDHGVHWN